MIYCNDIDPRACATLREMMACCMIPEGYVDDRSVVDVQPRELERYNRAHLFAGIGGFEVAAQLAGWPDDRQLWTGGFPCQPFSCAGRREGTSDDRYLWPEFFRLIRACRPEFVLVENVPGIDDEANMVLDRVCADLEGVGYEVWPAEIPACSVDAAHLRNRVWIVAHTQANGRRERSDVHSCRGGAMEHSTRDRRHEWRPKPTIRSGRDAATGAGVEPMAWVQHPLDQRFRRVPLGLLDPVVVLADGLPSRAVALHGLGNAIVPAIASKILQGMLRAAS